MTQATIGDTSDVEIASKENMAVLLGEVHELTNAVRPLDSLTELVLRHATGGTETGRSLRSRRHVVADADIRQLAVVRATRRAESIPRLQRVRVHVVTRLIRRSLREQVGVDEREVVAALRHTDGVLVHERREGDRVKTPCSPARSCSSTTHHRTDRC